MHTIEAVGVLLQARIHTEPPRIANGRVPEHRRLWAVVADAIIDCARRHPSRDLRRQYHRLLLRNELKHLPSGPASLLVSTLASVLRGRVPHSHIVAALLDPLEDVDSQLVAHFALQHANIRTPASTRPVLATLRTYLIGHGPCRVTYRSPTGRWRSFTRTTASSDVVGVIRVTSLPFGET